MATYKVTLLHLGQAYITAETKEAAMEKARNLPGNEVAWLSEAEGLSGKYLVILVEPESD